MRVAERFITFIVGFHFLNKLLSVPKYKLRVVCLGIGRGIIQYIVYQSKILTGIIEDEGMNQKMKLFKLRKDTNWYKRDKLRCFIWLLPKDDHGFLNFHLEACGGRVEDFKTTFWTKGANIFRTSEAFKDVGMFVRGEMFTDATGKVSVGFTIITGTTASTWKLINSLWLKIRRDRILGPKPTLDFKWGEHQNINVRITAKFTH